MSIDLRQNEIEEREAERSERQSPAPHRPSDLLVMFDQRLCLRVGDHLVYVADVFGAIDNLVDHGWIDPRLDVEDELRRIHRDSYKSGQLPERLT